MPSQQWVQSFSFGRPIAATKSCNFWNLRLVMFSFWRINSSHFGLFWGTFVCYPSAGFRVQWESSQNTMRLPWNKSWLGISFILAIKLRSSCFWGIKLRGHVGVYWTTQVQILFWNNHFRGCVLHGWSPLCLIYTSLLAWYQGESYNRYHNIRRTRNFP